LSAKEGNEILAKVWQRLSDLAFVRFLLVVLGLSPEGAQAALEAIAEIVLEHRNKSQA
jgi:hypothetical protein